MSSCMYYLTLEYFFLGLMKYSDSDNANVFFFLYQSYNIPYILHLFYVLGNIFLYGIYFMNQLWVLFLGKQTHLIAVSLECEVRFRRVFLCHIKSNTLSFLFSFSLQYLSDKNQKTEYVTTDSY